MRRVIVVIGIVMMIDYGAVWAVEDKHFNSSGDILINEQWKNVYVGNDNTIVNMFGGQIDGLVTSNISTFNMIGGEISHYDIGGINGIWIGRFGTLNIYDGSINTGDFILGGDSYGLISGGNMTVTNSLKMYSDSILDIRGGLLQINNFYTAVYEFEGLPTINIYGDGFQYSGGVISGYLSDKNPFSISGIDESEYQLFNLIPEPMTLLLLGLGGIFIRKRS